MKSLKEFYESGYRTPVFGQGRLANAAAAIRPYVPPINYITLHYAYFIFVTLIFALIFWGTSTPSGAQISFADSLYLTMSAITSAGMNTVNVSQMSSGQQAILVILMILGSPILISVQTLWFRKHVFEKRFRAIVKAERERKIALQAMQLLSFNKSTTKANDVATNGNTLTGLGSKILDRVGEEPDVEAEAGRSSGLAPPPATPGMPPVSPGARSIVFLEPPRHPHGSVPGTPSINVQHPTSGPGGFNINTFLEEKRNNIGRNGQFFNLTHHDREYLGGLEYRAIEVLGVTVSVYFILWQVLGAIALGAWLSVYAPDLIAANGQNAWWAGIFLAVSAFTNGGMSLLDVGMTAFQSGYYFVMIVVVLLMLAGGPAFPAFLRLIVWSISLPLKYWTSAESYAAWKETFDFILNYPRRVYTQMFPSRPTWYLVGMLAGLVLIDWIMIHVLSIGNAALDAIPEGPRVMDSFFQSVSVMSGGFAAISPSTLYWGVQILWVVIMYLSAYPGAITMRNSNVYEERSLGIYAGENDDVQLDNNDKKNDGKVGTMPSHPPTTGMMLPGLTQAQTGNSHMSSLSRMTSKLELKKALDLGLRGTEFVGRTLQRRMTGFNGVGVAPPARRPRPEKRPETPGGGDSDSSNTASVRSTSEAEGATTDLVSHHVRSQLSHDVWWIAFALFLITVIETSHSLGDPVTFSLFNIIFEVVSAYANNGISIGLPFAAFSFSGGWHTGSKMVLVLVMLRGRHRGLPVALDRAVRLPGLDLDEKEEDDAEIRRTMSRVSGNHLFTPNHGDMSTDANIRTVSL
ncbi:cation transport protein-domain-containing protein [Podospora didyma]|uniref:Cation transport protein-domain-containing protein n=1 Tax=Podospora didyma TaxID=330526 RepID=A0AAE0K473_9PEZI|nr:cation transport protein-domain-containing protein [Podospora didyma]